MVASFSRFAVLCCAATAARASTNVRLAAVNSGAVSPVTKVVELLSGLEAKVRENGDLEDKAFAEYENFCKGGTKDKEFEIKTAKADVEDLSATIAKADSETTAGASKVEELASTIGANSADLKAATAIRANESSFFSNTEAELVDVVDTLDRAINVLQRQMKGSALLQAKVNAKDVNEIAKVLGMVVDAGGLTLHDKKRLVALAQSTGAASADDDEADEAADLGAPAAEVYSAHSSSIIDVLEDLREKAEGELSEARKEEVEAKHNYGMLKQSLSDQVKADEKDMSESKSEIAAAAEEKAAAEGDLAVTTKDLADAEAALEELSTGCATAASDHEASVKSRAQELEAIAGATKAVSEMSTSGAADVVYSAASFFQTNSISHGSTSGSSKLATRVDLANFEVVNLVKQLAKKEKSAALAQLASRLAAVIKYGSTVGEDPFAKIKAMITDMISKLQNEASSEASHKEYCDKEMASTKEKIEELTSSIDTFKAKVDKVKATSVTLKGEVQTLNAEQAQLAKMQVEMNDVRTSEKAAFVQTKADLEQGLQGVRLALKLLREYYDNQEEGASFIQQPSMEYHAKDTGSGSGIIGMLEVIESDVGQSLAQSELSEDSSSAEYQKITQTNDISKATKSQDVKYKAKEAAALDKEAQELGSDMSGAQTELDAVLEYSQTIHGSCVAKPETYEERKGRREAEVAGLREALEILGDESAAALLQGARNGGLRGLKIHKH